MKRALKILGCAIVIVLIGVTGLYLVLLGMQAYSPRQASHLLDRIEALRVGDPAANFDSVIKGFPVKKTSSETLSEAEVYGQSAANSEHPRHCGTCASLVSHP